MKNPIRSVLFTAIALAFAVCLGCIATQASAQVAAAPAEVATAPTFADTVTAFIVTQAAAHPWIITIVSAIGILRLLFKPIVSGVEAWVKSTPQTTDDEFVEKIQHSAAFKAFAWGLDWVASIKIGPQFTATPKPAETPAPPTP